MIIKFQSGEVFLFFILGLVILYTLYVQYESDILHLWIMNRFYLSSQKVNVAKDSVSWTVGYLRLFSLQYIYIYVLHFEKLSVLIFRY